jgi:FKBP-type peptidyl-prolyl cis-trans isomerase 2
MKKTYLIILSAILAGLMLVMGCGGGDGAAVAKAGDTVKVNYTGTLKDGTQFDSSVGRDPLQFTLGSGQVIKGFDDAVTGMKVGEKKTVTIPAAQAYGAYRNDLVFEVDKAKLPSTITPVVGMQLQTTQQDGSVMTVTIKSINATTITLDANSPMAGKDLTFALELVEIVKK